MKNQKGITLVALVITIVVLLILAGVTISMVMGDNGVLKNSQKAKFESALGTAKESLSTGLSSYSTDIYAGEKAEKDFQSVTADSLKTELTAQMVGYDIISITGGEGSDFTVKVDDKDYGYTAKISSTSLTLKTFEFTDEKTHAKN